jgi:2,3,4,5-tetrahydropyridine-2-carboxylate N-succinyltransferase
MESFKKAREVLSEFLSKNISELKKSDLSGEQIFSVWEILAGLDSGVIRIANKINNHKDDIKNNWVVDQIAKIAINLSFLLYENKIINNKVGAINPQNLEESEEIFKPAQPFFDKIPSKFENWNEKKFLESKIRVVPGAYVRYSSFIEKYSVLMPSFVNMGAFIDSGTMIDTWASVGSCAQIGKNCHISGGAGIGGVLEPIGASPTIIEDNCFIGARSEVCEGVIVGEGSVIGMGCFIGSSTKIIDRASCEIFSGFVPPYSVVVPGTYKNKEFSSDFGTYCVFIIKKIDEKTRNKVRINDLLRNE